jgi:Cd2+/Zn2+-exporting ATPase/Cu+-exporting ATPase
MENKRTTAEAPLTMNLTDMPAGVAHGLADHNAASKHANDHRQEHHHDHHHAHDHEYNGHGDHDHALEWADASRIALIAVAAALAWFGVWEWAPFPGWTYNPVAWAAMLVGGYPIFKEALSNLLARRMTMELSMTLALAAALAVGESFTALVIALFVLVAEVLEGLTVGRGRRAIKRVLDLLPQAAFVRGPGGEVRELHAENIRAGDIVVVKPGGRVPVDGVVVSGHSFVDQATVTGESMPAEKTPGAPVYAGTINQSGALEVRTTGVGHDTAFGKIIQAVERAEKSRAPIQKTADRLAAYLVYFAVACAVLTFFVTWSVRGSIDVRSTISVVIVAGACGIAAGTPLAILGAIGRAARQGAVVKGGLYLEVLGAVDTVVMDKTGTVTIGNPEVTEVVPLPGVAPEAVVEAAAIAERPSEHPLAKAVLHKAAALGVAGAEPERFAYSPGKGVCCVAGGDEIVVGSRAFLKERGVNCAPLPAGAGPATEVLVARGGRLLGALRVADVLRPEAAGAVAALRRLGLRTVLLTGDAAAVAQAVGKELGADEVEADLLPDQKAARVKGLVAAGKKVAMVGDGVNDAPALTEASVGVAVGSGTDVARESADVVLIGNDLSRFVETLQVARRCRRIIWFNFAGTLLVDGFGVGLAAFGLLNPLLAAFIHVSSELAFILNSARLLPAASGPRRVAGDTEKAQAQAGEAQAA